MALSIDSPTVAALRDARRLLREASFEVADARHRVAALADATHWRARATAAYTAGITRLVDDLARLSQAIDHTDLDLIDAQRDEAARVAVPE